MSEFIPASDEQQAALAQQRTARLREFVGQWALEDIPACDEGISLLFDFAQAHPGVYRLAFVRGFDGDPHPMVKSLAKWKAYAEHVSACPKCNETGANVRTLRP